MPTLPRFDPANLPRYPEKPHKTGQARVNVDGKSQYLGKYGTAESYALYHLACARKLITGVVPSTRDLRHQMSEVAEDTASKGTIAPSVLTVVSLIVIVAVTSGIASHYLTRAAIAKAPILDGTSFGAIPEENEVGEMATDVDNKQLALDEMTSQLVNEALATFPNASLSDALDRAAARVKAFPERSQEHGKKVDTEDEG